MKIEVVEHHAPNLKRPAFSVDGGLAKHLDDEPVLSLMNRSHFAVFEGKAGSGKTSLAISLLQSKNAFKRVFHNICVFAPPNSRESVKGGSFFDKYIPPDQLFDEVTPETLNKAYELSQENAREGYRTLIIFDDVQRYFRDKHNMKILLHMCNNRRHGRLSMWVLCQNYLAIERKLRSGITDAFIFRMSKRELEAVAAEQLEMSATNFEKVMPYLFADPHDFLYVNSLTQRIFANWNELLITDA